MKRYNAKLMIKSFTFDAKNKTEAKKEALGMLKEEIKRKDFWEITESNERMKTGINKKNLTVLIISIIASITQIFFVKEQSIPTLIVSFAMGCFFGYMTTVQIVRRYYERQ